MKTAIYMEEGSRTNLTRENRRAWSDRITRSTRKSLKNINYLKPKVSHKYQTKPGCKTIDFTSPRAFKGLEKSRKRLRKDDMHSSTQIEKNLQVYLGNRKLGKIYRRSDLDIVKLEPFDTIKYKFKKKTV